MFFKKLSLVTGGFDPIHSGHISYFTRAKDFSDYLVVGINTEEFMDVMEVVNKLLDPERIEYSNLSVKK